MIDYEKVLLFCLEHDLDFEEFMLLYTIKTRNENYNPDIHPQMSDYYNKKKGKNWYDIIESLEKREFLIVMSRNKELKKFLLKDLMLTHKFSDLLFIQPDNIWYEFYKRYPAIGNTPDGMHPFTANMLNENDKEYFIKRILRNADKFEAQKILYYVEEMFDYNPIEGKPNDSAKVGITKFLRNWEEILRAHIDSQNTGNIYKNRLL